MPLEVVVTVRKKNQITLPKEVMTQLGIEPGDRLIFAVSDDDLPSVTARPIRRSYAGILKGVYGTPVEVQAYIDEERASWDQ